MSGKRRSFEGVDYCLLDIWIDNKSFGQLGELTSILFEDFGLSIGLSRDPRNKQLSLFGLRCDTRSL